MACISITFHVKSQVWLVVRARTCRVARSLTPTTAVLPTVPRPARSFLFGMLVSFLAADVSLIRSNGAVKRLL